MCGIRSEVKWFSQCAKMAGINLGQNTHRVPGRGKNHIYNITFTIKICPNIVKDEQLVPDSFLGFYNTFLCESIFQLSYYPMWFIL